MTAKKEAWNWCSKYIRLRDAIEHQKKNPEQPFGNVACCTCGKVTIWNKNTDACHYIPKGSRGMSGVYFDERNIHAGCKNCNGGFRAGRNIRHEVDEAYERFMLDKYGEETVALLHHLDKIGSYQHKIVPVGLMYKQMFEELKASTGLTL